MSLYVVSDLHICAPDDTAYRALIQLITVRLQREDILVLAGDVFDLFVGGKRLFRERYPEFFEGLSRAGGLGAQIHYIEGNHDFLVRRAFRDIQGVTVHSERVALEIAGKRFFFAHGDLVDQGDYGYRILRAILRCLPFRIFVRLLPGSWVDWIGSRLSRQSRQKRAAAAPSLLPASHPVSMAKPTASLPTERLARLRRLYRSYAAERLMQGNDFVVLGHCHDLDEMSFTIGGRGGQYINVGFPPAHGSFLSWSPGEEKIGRERFSEGNML